MNYLPPETVQSNWKNSRMPYIDGLQPSPRRGHSYCTRATGQQITTPGPGVNGGDKVGRVGGRLLTIGCRSSAEMSGKCSAEMSFA